MWPDDVITAVNSEKVRTQEIALNKLKMTGYIKTSVYETANGVFGKFYLYLRLD